MKKFALVLGAVLLAATTQAASFLWSSSGKMYTDASATTVASSGTFALMYLGNGTADWTSATEVATTDIKTSGSRAGKFSATLTFVYDSGTQTPYKNGDIFAVVLKNGTGDYSHLLSTADGTDFSKTLNYTIAGLTETTWAGTAFNAASGSFYAAPVPEPSSALLLLVGISALALRRRRA